MYIPKPKNVEYRDLVQDAITKHPGQDIAGLVRITGLAWQDVQIAAKKLSDKSWIRRQKAGRKYLYYPKS